MKKKLTQFIDFGDHDEPRRIRETEQSITS